MRARGCDRPGDRGSGRPRTDALPIRPATRARVSRVLWESCRPNGWRTQASRAEGWIGDRRSGQPVRAGRLLRGLRYHIGVIITFVPVSSAWTISPGPTYIVTCPTYPGLS